MEAVGKKSNWLQDVSILPLSCYGHISLLRITSVSFFPVNWLTYPRTAQTQTYRPWSTNIEPCVRSAQNKHTNNNQQWWTFSLQKDYFHDMLDLAH
jgi:hypothetical protein